MSKGIFGRSVKGILIGLFILVLSAFMGWYGEIDDAPGLVLIALLFAIFGLYLIIRKSK